MSEEKPPQEVLDILKKPYARVLLPDEESGTWSAFVVEFSGCLAVGDTPEEAARNLENAMEGWVWATVDRKQSIPEPRLKEDYSGNFVVHTTRSLHRQLAAHAALEGTNMNEFISTALSQEIGHSGATTSKCSKCGKRVHKGSLLPGRTLGYEGQTGFAEALCPTCYDKRRENIEAGREKP